MKTNKVQPPPSFGHGGSRANAGRPKSEPCTNVRVPQGCLPTIKQLIKQHKTTTKLTTTTKVYYPYPAAPELSLPLFGSHISAGFASPADDYIETPLDLNQHLIEHPATTFFLTVTGDSMIGAGIHEGDLLVVDRSQDAKDGKVVIAAVNGELTVKRLSLKDNGRVSLLPENPDYQEIPITTDTDLVIWGVVSSVIHTL